MGAGWLIVRPPGWLIFGGTEIVFFIGRHEIIRPVWKDGKIFPNIFSKPEKMKIEFGRPALFSQTIRAIMLSV